MRKERVEIVEEMSVTRQDMLGGRCKAKWVGRAYRIVTPLDERISTLCLFLGPSEAAPSFSSTLPFGLDSDLYTAAIVKVRIYYVVVEGGPANHVANNSQILSKIGDC